MADELARGSRSWDRLRPSGRVGRRDLRRPRAQVRTGAALNSGSVSAERKVIDSIHTPDGTYCVDVIRTDAGFRLEACRRDEERWQVIESLGSYDTQDEATAVAWARIAART